MNAKITITNTEAQIEFVDANSMRAYLDFFFPERVIMDKSKNLYKVANGKLTIDANTIKLFDRS